jgi:hypothetical protein
MHPLLTRILLNSAGSAAVLVLIGFGLRELAGLWLLGQAPVRADPLAPAPATGADAAAYGLDGCRIPLLMAGWGVAFVVVGESVMWVIRGRKRVAAPKPATPPVPDPAEQLLEQLLREAEAKQALTTTPSPVASDNTRV